MRAIKNNGHTTTRDRNERECVYEYTVSYGVVACESLCIIRSGWFVYFETRSCV